MKLDIIQGQHYIHSTWISGKGQGQFSSLDPTYGHLLSHNVSATANEVDQAVQSACLAFHLWKKLPLESRLSYLRRYGECLEHHRQALAHMLSCETGKVRWEADLEITSMIGKIEASIQSYHARSNEHNDGPITNRSVLRHRPHGVIAVFGPFNFPGHLPGSHIIPALLAGNTIIFKPSEYCPRFSMLMMACWHEAGLPSGVINMILGQAETGRLLSTHPGIQGLFFTGSAQVGQILHQQWGGHPEKLLVLEMGGNNPLIAWDIQNLDAAAYYIIQSAYLTAGQRCVCARRLIIENGQAGDQLLEKLLNRISRIQVGPYDQKNPEPFMGGLISRKSALSVLEAQNTLLKSGAQSLAPCQLLDEHSSLLKPGLIDISAIHNPPDQEIFGPLLQVTRVNHFNDAIHQANQTQYGLSAGLLSDRRDLYETFLFESRAGIINWNRPLTGASPYLPFGGTGLSGNHRPSAFYSADYCAYPVASMEADALVLPQVLTPGL